MSTNATRRVFMSVRVYGYFVDVGGLFQKKVYIGDFYKV